jgi:DNA-binding response OmpR family regulator
MKRILLIDSDKATSELTKKYLEDFGFEVTLTENGKQALDRLNEEGTDMVISEICLSGLTGFDVLQLMRKCMIKAPMVFFSSMDDTVTELEAMSMGASQLISKRRDFINLPHIISGLFTDSAPMVA